MILQVGCDLAEKTHYNNITRKTLARRCGTATGNISRIMGSMDELKRDVIKYALANDREVVIAQAIMSKHPAISHLSNNFRREVLIAALG